MSLTVREIAERVAPDMNAGEIKRLVRQLRHWTVSGIIKPEGPVYSGPGKHRKYSGEAVYLAALFVELSRYQLPVGILHSISVGFRVMTLKGGKSPVFRSMWRQAQAGERIIHAAISLSDVRDSGSTDDDYGKIASPTMTLYSPDDSPIELDSEYSVIVLNLTRMFSRLKE